MLTYVGTIVRAERSYKGQQWVTYDQQFRREVLARKDLNWSITDLRLYNEAFMGCAKSIARCSFCLQDDHTDAYCPSNPNRPSFNGYPNPVMWPAPTGWPFPQTMPACTPGPFKKSLEICPCFNDGRCKMQVPTCMLMVLSNTLPLPLLLVHLYLQGVYPHGEF